MFTNKLNEALIADVLARARQSPRLRANHCFHRTGDRLQRMVNAALAGSYFAPHRHQDPDKLEIFTILRGSVMIVSFRDDGEISDQVLLAAGDDGPEAGSYLQVEIPPRTWHSVVVLSPEAVLYEIIDGAYHPATHKRFASFAPPESDSPGSGAYLRDLLRRLGR